MSHVWRMVLVALAFMAPNAQATTFETLYTFPKTGSHTPTGLFPAGGLVFGPDLALYGLTSAGGAYSKGTLYRFDPAGNALQTLHSFGAHAGTSSSDGWNPFGGLAADQDGKLYGVTDAFGPYAPYAYSASIFRFDAASQSYAELYGFSKFAHPGQLVIGQSGTLYGTLLQQDIYKFDPSASQSPQGFGIPGYSQIIMGGGDTLYVIRQGTFPPEIDLLDPNTGIASTLYAFPLAEANDNPENLVYDPSSQALYGETDIGGANGLGRIFKLSLADNAFTTLYNFTSADVAPLQQLSNYRFGPLAIDKNGILYGSTVRHGLHAGGCASCGTIFKFDPASGVLTTLHVFSGVDGKSVSGQLLLDAGGALLGTAARSTTPNTAGTIFTLTP